ncbi:MAG: TlpA disulfide reductase family protein [Anaerolineae bacterium]
MKKHLLVILLVMLLSACNFSTELLETIRGTLPQAATGSSENAATLAPEFSFEGFDGQSYSLSDFHGQIVVLNFWASWCVPCFTETPILEALWQKYKEQGVVFIGLAYADFDRASITYLKDNDVTYINGADTGSIIADSYGVVGIPETFVIDKSGKISSHMIAPLTEELLRSAIDHLLIATPNQ